MQCLEAGKRSWKRTCDDSLKAQNCIHFLLTNLRVLGVFMGLSTHVLDTMHGAPAAGMRVSLFTTDQGRATLVKSFTLNQDGRNPDGPLYDNESLQKGTYRLVFDVKGYFAAKGVALPEPNFLDQVSLDFGVAHANQHYHVPLLVSPWSYSTYRGS
jgi:5-hydroxyisourate hydrolase